MNDNEPTLPILTMDDLLDSVRALDHSALDAIDIGSLRNPVDDFGNTIPDELCEALAGLTGNFYPRLDVARPMLVMGTFRGESVMVVGVEDDGPDTPERAISFVPIAIVPSFRQFEDHMTLNAAEIQRPEEAADVPSSES